MIKFKSVTPIKIANISEKVWSLLLLADPEQDKVLSYLTDGWLFLGSIQEEIVAVAVVKQLSPTCLEFMAVAVDPAYQKQGIGKKLLVYTIEQLKNEKLKNSIKLIVRTGDLSIEALKLYESQGFQEIARIDNYFVDNYKEPIFEHGERLRHQVILNRDLF